jgi:hypothetical protein
MWLRVKLERAEKNTEINDDLWRANRSKERISWGMVAAGFGGIFLGAALARHGLLNYSGKLLTWAGFALIVIGFIGLHWARAERVFLNRAEPKEMPKLWSRRNLR